MGTSSTAATVIRFGVYELDVRTSELRKHGIRIRLQEQPLQVLLALLERPGELVTREEIRKRVWPEDTFVSFDHALNTAVKKIRAALNDDADAPRFVETVPRRGYRFIAPVQASVPEIAPVPAPASEEPEAASEESISVPAARGFFSPRNLTIGISALALLTALVAYFNVHRAGAMGSRMPRRVMVAVLPFQNWSGDASQEYFSDGMTEETITQLGRLQPEQIGVIARTSAMKYKHAMKGIDEIGRELHVDYVLEGSIRRDGARVRIVAQLIRISDQSSRWSKEFDRNMSDVLSLETDVASAIAKEIESAVGSHASMQPISSSPVNPDAYDAYLRGLCFSPIRSVEGLKQVIASYQESLRKDPACTMTWAGCTKTWVGLASAYDIAGNAAILPPNESFPKAKEAALKAIQFDPTHPDAHVYLADALITEDLDWAGSEKEIKRALELDPNSASAHQWYGMYLFLTDKPDLGTNEYKRAVELDPLSVDHMLSFGGKLLTANKVDEAFSVLKIARDLDPDFAETHFQLSLVYEIQKKYDEAITELSTGFHLLKEEEAVKALQQTYPVSGFVAAKQAALREEIIYLRSFAKQHYVSSYQMAIDYSLIGDKTEALALLEKAYDERDTWLVSLRGDSNLYFSSIKDEPRFQELIRKIGYPS